MWNFKRLWNHRTNTFTVEVSCHEVSTEFSSLSDSGPYRWCIYCYIYPEHPLFKKIKRNKGYKHELPLHGGVTYFHAHTDKTKRVVSYQIGCDYNHLYDDHYTQDVEGTSVFYDAEQLIKYLENYEREPVAEVL